MTERLRTGIVGAAGYTGAELVRLIHGHPRLELVYVAARERAGQRLAQALPSTAGVPQIGDRVLEPFDTERAADVARRCDVVFTALPHGASVAAVEALYRAGAMVVDLSAAFRLKDRAVAERWYGEAPSAELLARAVYGQPELHRRELAGARLIAAPGCHVTGALLALSPLLRGKLVEKDGLIVNSVSGVSGGGRSPAPAYHFPEAAEGLRPYKIAGAHRHTPEIEQELSLLAGQETRVLLTPHLAPMNRGILTVAYGRAARGASASAMRESARDLYEGGLVTVLDEGSLPDTLHVRGSARAHVGYALDERTGLVLAMCAQDNLSRGASAQAVQAFNVARGWPDALGLPEIGLFP